MQSKALLLQSRYGLSDPGLEKQLARDLMFRRFINLGLSKGVPDHSTIWRFRNTLTKQGLLDTLLAEVNRHLSAKGLYIQAGEVSIVDATVIEAKQSRPRKGKDGANTQDGGAGYSVKVAANGKTASTYGYKAHVNVDEDGFIKAVDHTPGNEHDPKSLEKRLTGAEEQVYADQSYASAGHDRLLAKRNIGNRILAQGQAQPAAERPPKTPESAVVKHPQHRGTCVRHPQATLSPSQGALLGAATQPSPVHADGDGLQHQARRGDPGRDAGWHRIIRPMGAKTAKIAKNS
ncbi:MAG: IS5 family transposase [Methylomonas sp.]|nr:IS5 family transposase [Methylomonas sp.]PPD19558.1 MAG: hypothetical protein CTY23_11435 [Methylomonas sp.]PPD25073.1 MAG: hypothetical protein CTY22_09785 [Methylomonas sp.]PPD34429.1 MAG: hypothetical protein CTY21_09815 [Methylomonas sp.]PPD38750.1 MAG: hypothetical protein CTY17_08985 [Methylomonas sp.]